MMKLISDRAVHAAGSIKVLVEAGVVRPMRPDRALKVLQTLARWGRSPAAGAISWRPAPRRDAIADDLGTLTFSEMHRRTTRSRTPCPT